MAAAGGTPATAALGWDMNGLYAYQQLYQQYLPQPGLLGYQVRQENCFIRTRWTGTIFILNKYIDINPWTTINSLNQSIAITKLLDFKRNRIGNRLQKQRSATVSNEYERLFMNLDD